MSTIIKATGVSRAADTGAFNLEDLGDRATAYLDEARRKAAELVAQAQQEADGIRRAAEESGRAAAVEAAERALDEKLTLQLTTLAPAMREAIDAIHGAKAQWLLHWERTAVHVASAIAGRVIRRELVRAPEITLALVREALDLAAGNARIQLRMHPDDVAALGEQVERLARELARLGQCEIVADPSIEKGGCRLETRFGAIDQQFTAQLARIEEELA
jgi:flagellar assembly protein FliH